MRIFIKNMSMVCLPMPTRVCLKQWLGGLVQSHESATLAQIAESS